MLVASCGDDSVVTLRVDLRTDYAPGRDFVRIETDFNVAPFTREDMEGGEHERRIATVDDDAIAGIRVAQLYGLPKGRAFVRVKLVSASGATIGSRTVAILLDDHSSITVFISHACADVECPGDLQCAGGACVDWACAPEQPALCGDAVCETDADCAAPSTATCATSMCREGRCFAIRSDSMCPSGQVCDLLRGCAESCLENETSCNDGVDEDCDGDTDCQDSDCTSQPCDDGFWCNGETDTCGPDGLCSRHGAAPCERYCNEAEQVCDACATDADCGAETAEAWTACEGFTAACDDTGTQMRVVTTPRCVAAACTMEMTTEMRDCTRTDIACCPERSCPTGLSDAIGMARTPTGDGYWIYGRGGTLVPFGDARCCIGPTGAPDGRAEAIEADPSGYGFYALGITSRVFTYGDAPLHGSGGLGLTSDMAADSDGSGYWIVNLAGDTRAFDADELDDLMDQGVTLGAGAEIVGIAAEQTSVRRGAWMIANDCTVYATPKMGMVLPVHGSPRTTGPTTGCTHIAGHPSCSGYWVVHENGQVFAYGCATHHGDASTMSVDEVIHIEPTASGDGYWLVAEDGAVFAFGDATDHGGA
jgi:hypothetical protein